MHLSTTSRGALTGPHSHKKMNMVLETDREGSRATIALMLKGEERKQVGLCKASPAHFRGREMPDWAFIGWLEVEPEWRGHGLGKTLMSAMMNLLARNGVSHAVLTTHADTPAKHLYFGMGFEEVGRGRTYAGRA